MLTKWTSLLAGIALIASTMAAVAQDAPSRVDIARYPAVGQPMEARTATPGNAGTVAGAPDAVPSDGMQPGLVENGWDFSRPETIPGFGPWQPTNDTPEVKRAGAE